MSLKMMELSTLNMDLLGFGSPNNFSYESLSSHHLQPTTEINNTDDWLEDVESPFRELEDIQEVSSPSMSEEFCMDSTQNLIDEMEQFLVHHETKQETEKSMEPSSSLDESSTFDDVGSIALDPRIEENRQSLIDEDVVLESETKMAVDILDALMTGNITTSNPVPPPKIEPETGHNNILVDYSNLTNVSEFVLEDGRNVIIMIADSPSASSAASNKVVSPPSSSVPSSSTIDLASLGNLLGCNSISPSSPASSTIKTDDDDDADWNPTTPISIRRSSSDTTSKEIPKTGQRGVAKTKRKKSTILDKKERKKWQNVEAARRYRDKKKIEQVETEVQVKMLQDKNANLKDKLKEMENEVTTMKKLMTELGLLKTST